MPAACGALPRGRARCWRGRWLAEQAVAARTRAVDFAQGILRVEVPDAGWRVELQALAPQYLAVINRYVAESVQRIEFVIGDKAAGEGARATRA